MVATNVKAETSSLMEKRSWLEAEMNTIIARLSQPGAPGLSGNLLDSEGFPRSDIDVPIVRAERRRLADIQTSSTVETVASTPSQNVLLSLSPNSMDVDVLVSRPFAVVDEIADASPAVEDGLQLGDQILKFGNVEAGDNLIQRLASEAQSSMGQTVPVVIMRQGTVINLTITPRTWQGRGLLGCHFRIL
uniref:26S proteasome non-ATPase regulatory subunit 9 isoform X3 n=1 Tax=Cicer arietinum TaxID=3827 RepID=A0A3Q7Y1A9_CICAR|nr:26S proteasome non-ATPase regulatory subunit 9 isoform X3 [Cicer arietinum]